MKPIVIFSLVCFCGLYGHSQSNFSKVDDWLSANTAQMGGRSILVVYKDGQILYNHAVNNMNMQQKMVNRMVARRQGKIPDLDDYTLSKRQPIASCSKWLSAALVMTFVDQERLHLTDTVGKYLPVLSQHGKGGITVGQCLSHLTGIKAPPLRESMDEMKEVTNMDEAIEQIANLPMEGEPGKTFHYSNAGLQIAGAILEKISGRSFQSLFAERIAGPLQMKNTDWGTGKVALPAGGAISTPEDYLNFLVMILNRGVFKNRRILSERSILQMQVNRITPDVKVAYSPAEAGGLGYGYGEWIMDSDPNNHITTSVSSPGLFGSFPWVDYKEHYAAFLMTFYLRNTGRGERYTELKQLVSEATH